MFLTAIVLGANLLAGSAILSGIRGYMSIRRREKQIWERSYPNR